MFVIRFVFRMIRRLQHWLHVLPPVEGTDITLLRPAQAQQLCGRIEPPGVVAPRSQVTGLEAATAPGSEGPAAAQISTEAAAAAVPSDYGGTESAALSDFPLPDFPLLPVSRGFHMKLQKLLAQFDATLTAAGILACEPGCPS